MKKRLFLTINKAKPQSDCSVHNSGSYPPLACGVSLSASSHLQTPVGRLTLESPQGLWDGGGRSPRTVSTGRHHLHRRPGLCRTTSKASRPQVPTHRRGCSQAPHWSLETRAARLFSPPQTTQCCVSCERQPWNQPSAARPKTRAPLVTLQDAPHSSGPNTHNFLGVSEEEPSSLQAVCVPTLPTGAICCPARTRSHRQSAPAEQCLQARAHLQLLGALGRLEPMITWLMVLP